jgi:hypothetical protein
VQCDIWDELSKHENKSTTPRGGPSSVREERRKEEKQEEDKSLEKNKNSEVAHTDNVNRFLYIENPCTPKMSKIGQVLSEKKNGSQEEEDNNKNSSEP